MVSDRKADMEDHVKLHCSTEVLATAPYITSLSSTSGFTAHQYGCQDLHSWYLYHFLYTQQLHYSTDPSEPGCFVPFDNSAYALKETNQ